MSMASQLELSNFTDKLIADQKVIGCRLDTPVQSLHKRVRNKGKWKKENMPVKGVRFQDTAVSLEYSNYEPTIGIKETWTSWTPNILQSERPVVMASQSTPYCCLEFAAIDKCGWLHGHIAVSNRCFQKNIFVRVTLNQWESFIDIEAVYCYATACVNLDFFEFNFDLNGLCIGNCNELRIDLAVRCIMNGMETWDNNNNLNYQLYARSAPHVPTASIIVPLNDIKLQNAIKEIPCRSASSTSLYAGYFLPSSFSIVADQQFKWSF